MNFKEHFKAGLLGGTVTTLAFSALTKDPQELAAIFGLSVAGALFPDLDTQSTPSKFTAIFLTILCAGGIFYREPYVPLYFATAFCFIKTMNHRSWSHVWLLPAACFVLPHFTNILYFIPFGIGISVHLIADKLWPWKIANWHKFHLPKMLK